MKVWKDIKNAEINNPVVTIGIFDGVHSGHHFLLDELKRIATAKGGESVVITLWPHPRIVLNKQPEKLRYLTTISEKEELLRGAGIDHFLIIPFTREFSKLGSCEFVEEILVKQLHLKHLLIGFNHKFGRNREGDYQSLKDCAGQYGFEISQLSPREKDGKRISSSAIRELLFEGKVDDANELLGYDYFLQGKVTGGSKLGRRIGFPTANIEPFDQHKLIPEDGVYAVFMKVKGHTYKGMMNIGLRPTVNDKDLKKTIEVNLFDFEGDLYDQHVSVSFCKRIRDEKKFAGVNELKEQLIQDRQTSIEILNKLV